MRYEKDFIIVGNKNTITYKEIFPLIMSNKMWLGYGFKNDNAYFKVPSSYALNATSCKEDKNGQYFIPVGVMWFTNIENKRRHEPLTLYKHYSPEEYPKYDNYDAINVDKVSDIPMDYDGVMGVPITFMKYYCPEQFEIVAFRKGADGKDLVYTNEGGETVQPYFRILIQRQFQG